MSLRGAPFMYVFLETTGLQLERFFWEYAIGLPVLETEPHLPHHRHGAVKYDAVNMILSLNWNRSSVSTPDSSDALITVFQGNPRTANWSDHPCIASVGKHGLVTDVHGHHFVFSRRRGAEGSPLSVPKLRLMAADLPGSVAFYRDILGLELQAQTETTASFATGTVTLTIEENKTAPDGRRPRYDTYLLVFYTPQVESARDALMERGLAFKSPRVAHSEIGYTARFEDPSGHRFCLYDPSQECLSWRSGPKVMEIMERSVVAQK